MICALIRSTLLKIMKDRDIAKYAFSIYARSVYQYVQEYIEEYGGLDDVISLYSSIYGNTAFYKSKKSIKMILSLSNDSGIPDNYMIVRYIDIDDNVVETYISNVYKLKGSIPQFDLRRS